MIKRIYLNIGDGNVNIRKDDCLSEYVGQIITEAEFDKEANKIRLKFKNGKVVNLSDGGQNCCEERYMVCDDDLSILVNNVLKDICILRTATVDDPHEEHEVCFLEIQTDKNSVSVVTHNLHNGYYGGFDLALEVIV